MFGDGTGNAVHRGNIEYELRQQAINRSRTEYDQLSADGSMNGALSRMNFNEPQRTEEILAELMDKYTDADE